MQITNSRRRSWRPLVWGLVIALGAVSAVAGKVDRRHPGKLSAKARDDAGRKGGARMDVLVRFRKTPGAAENALVKAFGGSVRRPLKSSSRWMSLRLPASVVAKLAENAIVEFVASDPLVGASLDSARQTSNEPQASQPESAFKGAGVTIAEVDSGVALHPDIQTLVAAADIVNPASVNSLLTGDAAVTDSPLNSIDPNGHGTHVAGILVGTGSHSPDGRLAGIAPQASLVSVRVLDDQGHGTSSDVLAGLQWVLDHKDQYGIRVLNLSLGHPIYEPAATDPLVQAVDALW